MTTASESPTAPPRHGQVVRHHAVGVVALLAVVAAYLVVGYRHLGGMKWDSDEGINVHLAWLVHDGYPLYARVWSDHAPGLIVTLAWAFRVAGVSLTTARTLTLAYGALGLLAVAGCAAGIVVAQGQGRRAAWLAGLSATALLAIAPNFWWASRAAMIDVPTLSLAALAMAAAFAYSRTGGRGWLVTAGAAFGLSLWVKYHLVYLAPLLVVLVVLTRRGTPRASRTRAVAMDLALGVAASVAPLALSLMVFDARALIDQSVLTLPATVAHYPVDMAANWATVRTWLVADNAGLAVLALAGVLAVIAAPERTGLITLAWAGLTVVTALRYAPLYIKVHLEPLLFVLAVLGGVAVGSAAGRLLGSARTADGGGRWHLGARAWLVVLAASVGCLAYAAALPHVLAVDQSLLRARGYDNTGEVVLPGSAEWDKELRREERMTTAAAFLRTHSTPDDFVITDHQIIAFDAGRRMPPEMAVINSRAIDIGLLTPERLIELTERYAVPAVLVWDESVATPAYVAWLRQHYDLVADFGNDRWGFVRRTP
jgi:hypothetical protein